MVAVAATVEKLVAFLTRDTKTAAISASVAVLVAHGNVALTAHPPLGNFGAGAGFALEDVYALTKTLDWAWSRGKIADATRLVRFDPVSALQAYLWAL